MAGRGPCSGRIERHHVIERRALKKRGLLDHLWDLRNRLFLCTRHHSRHTTAVERIPLSMVPPAAVEFAEELGLSYLIERYYPDDLRADRGGRDLRA